MPELGEIRRAKDAGGKGKTPVIWIGCPTCGKERWVQTTRKGRLCRSCNARHLFQHSCHKGVLNPMYRGGHYMDGYSTLKLEPDDFFYPMAQRNGWVFEHRLIMAKHLGRCLQSWELVHHRNGIKEDNNIKNLCLVTDAGHKQITHLEKTLKRQQAQIKALQDRVIILEAENILFETALDIEPNRINVKEGFIKPTKFIEGG